MATTEQSRRRLHRELTEVMGEERATMLVDELPPVDWAAGDNRVDISNDGIDLHRSFRRFTLVLLAGNLVSSAWIAFVVASSS